MLKSVKKSRDQKHNLTGKQLAEEREREREEVEPWRKKGKVGS